MSHILTPTLRITLGILSLTISLLLAAQLLGFLPDRTTLALENRQKFCEAIAMQISWAASRNDGRAIQNTLESVVSRNDELLSAAFRAKNNAIKAVAGKHDENWVARKDGVSTPTHVQVPILNAEQRWGTVELTFKPLDSITGIRQISESSYGILIFIGLFGFGLYFLFLRRVLKELDPAAVIPERVKAAFDVLAEGLIIVDEEGYIVLANETFGKLVERDSALLTGVPAVNLDWRTSASGGKPEILPWQLAAEHNAAQVGVPLMMSTKTGVIRTLMVNCSPILDGKGSIRGALATFDDVTDLEKRNTELRETLSNLSKSRAEVKRQNDELRFLATRDPLTGCLNRRAAFERFEGLLQEAEEANSPLTCLMIDIDFFKKINDRYGHAAGDKVIKYVARIMRETARVEDVVARYGGEEFCVVLPGLDLEAGRAFAEKLRVSTYENFNEKFTSSRNLTISLGVAAYQHDSESAMQLINRADEALYVSKDTGRNKVTCWSKDAARNAAAESAVGGGTATEPTMLVEKLGDMNQTMPLQTLSGKAGELESLIAEKSLGMHRKHGFDELTGLPNRVLFYDRLSQALAGARREGKFVAALNLDVNLTRKVGENHELIKSDELLKQAAQRIGAILRENDTVTNLDSVIENVTISRLATTEFGVSLTDMESTETVTWIVQRLFDALSNPIVIDDGEVFANCNVGISMYPNDGNDVETLIRNASTARHHAKVGPGRHKFMFFAQEMNDRSYEQMKLDTEMRAAIENDEFELHYQPAFNIKTNEVAGFEALIRWQHPELGLLMPDQFIPIAEHTGFIGSLGDWVVRTACEQIKQWEAQGLGPVRIAMNLSAVQLRSEYLDKDIEKIIAEVGVDPSLVELEVTETALMADVQHAQRLLHNIRDLGVQIAIDDFGTGYSSLSHLKHFVIDKLKIDKSFIDDVTRDKRDAAVVGATIAMAKLLDATVVAEGVETQAQLEFLRKRQCDHVQGYLLSRPLTLEKASELLEKEVANRQVPTTPRPEMKDFERTEMFTRLLD
jgi:diguanylate cyclase (GGDEF)-like protein